jgi:hypothetical protein
MNDRYPTTSRRAIGHTIPRLRERALAAQPAADTGRFIQIRGDAELVAEGALEHLDAPTRQYTRHHCYYGFIYPVEQQARETRVIYRIHARRITLDAIHS